MNLYVLVFLHIGSRRLWLSPTTRHTDTAWVRKQSEGFLAHAQSANLPATIMVRGNDVKYPPEFDTVLKSAGLEVLRMFRCHLNHPATNPQFVNLPVANERFFDDLRLDRSIDVVLVSRKDQIPCTQILNRLRARRGQNRRPSQRSRKQRLKG